ncbi:GntR family transcriptional regulator [Arthrobacter sp. MYb224]|uniref:GntR family transcriptional regulator n=1 Tax=unclassified Arthrobacter TaxID=235627 RepID=UPI000CFD829B|nr:MULTISPECIES: GntR family transcriptional regulator [unclassified Arthrobacter]PQZ97723.1 GntR family transcriptional regulator [Arthrobacter sp. MYb224]PRA04045.1 GntR family transcriptional regulator [Arthrobacter sp. MYb229]PRB52043.1 GntR family transcriptional regulator [Arthrobacter sp. MYb216]
MSHHIFVDLDAAVPPYEQIRTQISSLISLGELPAGSKLPTVRALATDLGVASGTVARAYKELEATGLVSSRRRAGTLVNAGADMEKSSGDLVQAVDRVWELARAQGIDEATVRALVQRRARQ